MASKRKQRKWWWQWQKLGSNGRCNNHICLLLGQSSDCHRCHHSFYCRCRLFRCCHRCHNCRRCFFCCRLLLIVVVAAVVPFPLSLLSSMHLPLSLPLLIDCCLYPSTAINVSSSSPHPLSSRRSTPALVTASMMTSPLPSLPPSLLPCVVHQPLSLLVVVVHPSPLVELSAILVVEVNFIISRRGQANDGIAASVAFVLAAWGGGRSHPSLMSSLYRQRSLALSPPPLVASSTATTQQHVDCHLYFPSAHTRHCPHAPIMP